MIKLISISLVGDSLNSSIPDYIFATSNQPIRAPTDREAVLAGLTNSFTAIVDDILVSYASAQLMIAGEHASGTCHRKIQRASLRPGLLHLRNCYHQWLGSPLRH